MGKSRRGDKEFTKEQKLIHENKQLKKRVAQLHKQLMRLDVDRYENIKEIIEQHYQQDRVDEGRQIMQKVKQEWKCHTCGVGTIEIIKYAKLNEEWYFRKCSNANCGHRTPAKKYTPDVSGVFKDLDDSGK